MEVKGELHSCEITLRDNPQRRKAKVFIGCGAGFGGDRPMAALKLLQRVDKLDYLVLECLAERTLADRYQVMMSGGVGYDPRISEWMSLLLPLSVKKGVCIITNMGAMDPFGAQKEVLDAANNLGLDITVSLLNEIVPFRAGFSLPDEGYNKMEGVYELGWNWNDFKRLAQGSLAGHLLECGCQLTGGYFMHPGDKYRDLSFQQLLDLSLPYAEVGFDGEVCVAKADGSGGILNHSTCSEQLLYEVGDPSAYVTPDLVIDFQDVYFCPLSNDKVLCLGAKPSTVPVPDKLLQLVPKGCGWKGWGEISYGGYGCVKRAVAASLLVRSWMEEAFPGVGDQIVSYLIGVDSLKATKIVEDTSSIRDIMDVRLRMDGLFEIKEHAVHFAKEFMALYTNGPAGGGGISTGHKKEIILSKVLAGRESIFWQTDAKQTKITSGCSKNMASVGPENSHSGKVSDLPTTPKCEYGDSKNSATASDFSQPQFPAPGGRKICLYQVVHSRAGDKGNDLNFSIIPHFPQDIERLKIVITPNWVKGVVSPLLDLSSFPDSTAIEKRNRWVDEHVTVEIYEARGIHSLNVVVRNILDGGVNCSRRIDRHGKAISDLILCQEIVLPP